MKWEVDLHGFSFPPPRPPSLINHTVSVDVEHHERTQVAFVEKEEGGRRRSDGSPANHVGHSEAQ